MNKAIRIWLHLLQLMIEQLYKLLIIINQLCEQMSDMDKMK